MHPLINLIPSLLSTRVICSIFAFFHHPTASPTATGIIHSNGALLSTQRGDGALLTITNCLPGNVIVRFLPLFLFAISTKNCNDYFDCCATLWVLLKFTTMKFCSFSFYCKLAALNNPCSCSCTLDDNSFIHKLFHRTPVRNPFALSSPPLSLVT